MKISGTPLGLRRALGSQQNDNQAQFIVQSVALRLVGGVIGIVLAVMVSLVFAKTSKGEFLISYSSILLVFGVDAAVGSFSEMTPADLPLNWIPSRGYEHE